MCNSGTVVEKMFASAGTNLFPPQQALLDAGYLESDDNWIICSPTGSGKTLMAEWAMRQVIEKGLSAVYVAPLRAIVAEKRAEWEHSYPGLTIGLFTGESTRNPREARPRGENLLLMTPEKRFMLCSS